MSWIKVTDFKPPENEPILIHDDKNKILIHDDKNNRMETGLYLGGRWYVEDVRDGTLREIAGVTHWGRLLDSQLDDDGDDD